MSAGDHKPTKAAAAAAAAATTTTTTWWIPSKLLTSSLFLSLLLIWALDASAIHGRSPPSSAVPLLPLHFLGNISASLPHHHHHHHYNHWISVPFPSNFTSILISRWRAPGGSPCRDSRTTTISIPSLDSPAVHPIKLPTGQAHEFVFTTSDEAGNPRCLGGDYFETDLSGDSWKSRPPLVDHGNGSYSFKLQVHPDFAGSYNLNIVLLFRSFEGLKLSPLRFKFRKLLRQIPITFYHGNNGSLPDLEICNGRDFSREVWSGRWTRHAKKDDCSVDNDGRYRCLDHDLPCQRPWCDGPLGVVESNGWVYSAHCSFQIFTQDSAWQCLNNRWLFFWGDSNHVDTIRNLLNFVLGQPEIATVPRRFDMSFKNPRNGSEAVRITSIFNGHWNETMNYLGLESLRNEEFRLLLWKYFAGDTVPDTMIFNSGLHDGVYWRSIRGFAEAAEYAAGFWEEVMQHVREKKKGIKLPRVFYRTTIATGGYARDLAFNPSKMEVFNGMMVEKLKERGVLTGGVVDEFDMTFPWHYDNRCNDGVHYGRPPAKARWRDGEIGHQYFVDLMLAHVLLNAVCNA